MYLCTASDKAGQSFGCGFLSAQQVDGLLKFICSLPISVYRPLQSLPDRPLHSSPFSLSLLIVSPYHSPHLFIHALIFAYLTCSFMISIATNPPQAPAASSNFSQSSNQGSHTSKCLIAKQKTYLLYETTSLLL